MLSADGSFCSEERMNWVAAQSKESVHAWAAVLLNGSANKLRARNYKMTAVQASGEPE